MDNEYQINDPAALDQLLSNPGGTPPAEPPKAPEPGAEGGTPPAEPPAGDPPPAEPPADGDKQKADDDAKQKADSDSKQHQAFAAMRTQLKAQTTVLSNIAKALDITFADEADLVAKLADMALDKIAAKSQLPKEILQRLQDSEAIAAEKKLQDLQTTNLNALNGILDQFKFPKEVVIEFANELAAEGVDWRTTELDLTKEFKVRKLDLILEQHAKQAEEQALLRQQAANNNSSKSKDSGSKSGGTPGQVNDMNALENLIKGLGR